jgi:1,4-dihydroxy-2-naphthoyl-CoA synthase
MGMFSRAALKQSIPALLKKRLLQSSANESASAEQLLTDFKDIGTGRVDLSVNDGIVMLKLNNPSKKNALSPSMMSQLYTHLKELSSDKSDMDLYGLILAGEDNTFCSGFGACACLQLGPYIYKLGESSINMLIIFPMK